MMTTCNICGTLKVPGKKCKPCVDAYNKAYHKKRYSSDQEYRERKLSSANEWVIKNPDARAVIAKRRNSKVKGTPQVKARALVAQRVRFGRMPAAKDLKCSRCEKQATGYHHYLGYDFENRYDVEPLCNSCHKEADNFQATSS